MTVAQQQSVRDMVAEFDAPATAGGVFARTVADLTGYTGTANLTLPPVNIPLVHDRAIKEPPRRYTGKEREEIDKKFNELKAAGLIERASDTNQYAMNMTVPSKLQPDGSVAYRVCGDARRLNEATVCDGYQIPRIEDLFEAVASKAWISKADCRAAFAQLWLAEEDRSKTAFWWGRERWQHKRLLYGLRNATSHWQRVVDSHAREYGLEGVLFIYVDDCALVSDTFEEHLEHLRRFFTMMRDIGIKLHPDKTYLCADSIDYLGHQISGKGMSPVQARVAAFQALRPPTSLNACQRLLGLLNYYRCYIDHWAVKMAPITKLLKKDVTWGADTWGPEQQQALDTVKAEFAREGLILRAYDPSRPLILHTDWCEDGLSGVLGQLDDDAREYMVACVSRTCNVHERRYGSYKGELLAAVWAIQTLRPYLHATQFTLVTDHAPLEWLMSQPELTGQAARWAMILQQYSFSVVHRPGLLNQNADALSRDPMPSTHDSTGARLDNDDDPLPVPPQRVEYPGKGWPRYAAAPGPPKAPPMVAVTTLATAGMRAVLPPFAAVLCAPGTHSGAVLPPAAVQPWAAASRMQFACLHATLATATATSVPEPSELLHDEDGEITLRAAALIVVAHARALRALRPAPRLRLRTSATHGSVAGISTFLRQHALIFAAETDAISMLEAPGGLAPGLQACLQLGWRVL